MDDPLHIIPLLFTALCIAVIISTALLFKQFEGWLESKHPALPWLAYAIEVLALILVFYWDFVASLDWHTISWSFLILVFSLAPLVLLCFACSFLDKRKDGPNWLKNLSLAYVVSFFPALFIIIFIGECLS